MSEASKVFSIEAKVCEAYDVIVCGGGTAGCVAALASARGGAKTLLIERSFSVGGMLTIGNAGITKATIHYSNQEEYRNKVGKRLGEHPEEVQIAGGIMKEYCHRMMENGSALGTDEQVGGYVFTDRYGAQFTMMDMLEEAGVQVLYDTKVCGVSMDDNKVTGVLVFNKSGFCEYPAKRVVDATGDADVAAFSGAEFSLGVTEEDLAEGCGEYVGQLYKSGSMYRVRNVDFDKLLKYVKESPERFLAQRFNFMPFDDVEESIEKGDMAVFRVWVDKPDGTQIQVQIYNAPASDEAVLLHNDQNVVVNALDAMDLSNGQTELFKQVRANLELLRNKVPGFEHARISHLPDIGVRETRRIKGDYMMTGKDLLEGVDFEDSVGCGGHPIDIKPLREDIANHYYENWCFHMPYRIMLPQKIENLLVAGRCVSTSRMTMGCVRPTVQCMVLGEAAGTAAAMSVKDDVTCRQVDIKKLRAKLIENGAIL